MPPRMRTVATATFVCAVGVTAAAFAHAEWLVRAEVAGLPAAVTVGGVDVNLFAGRVTLRDVAMTNGANRIVVARLTLPLATSAFALVTPAAAQAPAATPASPDTTAPAVTPAPPDTKPSPAAQTPFTTQAPSPAPAQTGTISASDVMIVSGATTTGIRRIDIAGTTLTNADLATLLDIKSPDTLASRIARVKAASIVITELSSVSTTPGAQFEALLHQIVLTNVAGGRVETASAASGSFVQIAPGGQITVTTGTLQGAGIDIPAFQHVANALRTDDNEALRPLVDAFTVNNLAVVNADQSAMLTIAVLTEKGVKGRPLKDGLKDLASSPPALGGADTAMSAAQAKAALDDLSTSFAHDALSLDRVSVSNKEPAGTTRLGFSHLGLDGYRARNIAAFTVRDFVFSGPAIAVTAATLDVADLQIPPAKTNDAPAGLATDTVPTFSRLEMGGIDLDATETDEDGDSSRVRFKLAHALGTSDKRPGQPPHQGSFAFDHLTFDLPAGTGPGARELTEMGYKSIDLSGAVDSAYDADRETLTVPKLLLSGAGMGSVTLAADLINVGRGILSANPSVARATALSMLLKHVDMRVVDDGLVDRVLAWRAKQDGRSVTEERNGAVDLFAVTLPATVGGSPGAKAIGAALAKFVAAPGTLHIAATAENGLGLTDLGLIGSPDDLFAKLAIEADAKR